MEDFLRLNLNAAIVAIPIAVMFVIAFFVIIFKFPKGAKGYSIILLGVLFGIAMFLMVIYLTTQVSVNVLPKATIDREFTNQSQEDYQNRVQKNSKLENK